MTTSTLPLTDDPADSTEPKNGQFQQQIPIEATEAREFPIADTFEPPLQERRLVINTPLEATWQRWLYVTVALLVAVVQHAFSHTYWAPGHYGNNQNAYLVGGKMLATTGTTGFQPKSPWEFVGWMWNMADGASTAPGGGWMYPKYPAGLPLLNAIVYKISYSVGGMDSAVYWTHKISPLCTTAATLGIFFITRLIAGSFAGVLGMISFATLSVVLVLMNNPYSHAADMGFVTWGIYALLKWWQRGGWWRGSIAGFLLGYAATIRYTEGLLVLPLIAAVLCSVRWTKLRSWMRVSIPIIAWGLPLFVLVVFNYFTVGSFTGYDSTNESTGFTLTEMARKWRWGVDQFYNTGLYILMPLTIGGLLMGFKWNWRVALVLTLWYVPSTLLYLSYYWGMNLPVWGFLRFFSSVFPAGVIAAMWMLHQAASAGTTIAPLTRRRAMLTGLVVTGVSVLTLAIAWAAFKPNGQFETRAETSVVLITLAAAIVAAAVCNVGRGGTAMAAIAMGVLVAFPAAINVDVSDAPLERDHTIATNLNFAGQQIRRVAPDGSLVFANGQKVGNFLQFAGNYELYGTDYIMGGRPVPMIRGGPASDNPNPIQPARVKFVSKVYEKYDDKARVTEATRISVEAIHAGRRVFIVKEVDSAGALIAEMNRGGQVKAVEAASWIDPAKMSARATIALTTAGADGIARREPWRWKVFELKLADASTSAPTTAPATAPTTEPTN